jgi:hypothetical protein
MTRRRWAALPVIVGVLTGNVALAAADVSPATPAPTPSPTPGPTTAPVPSENGPGNYVTTVTTTTTIINAPVTVVAAPISTTINNLPAGWTPAGSAERFVINLRGCGRSALPTGGRARRANIRLGRNASLVVRVNGRRVTALRLPEPSRRHRRGVALRLRLAPSGMLTIRRPSGRILTVQGCTPA